MEVVHIVECQGTVYVEDPFGDITGHVVQTIVIREVGTTGSRDVSAVVEVSCNTHVVAGSSAEVIHEASIVTAFIGTCVVAVPGVIFLFNHALRDRIADESEGSIFPFGFGREPVFREHDPVFQFHLPGTGAVRVEVGQRFVHQPFILTGEVSFRVKVVFFLLRRIHGQNATIDQQLFIHPVGTPGAVIIRLNPRHADHRVVPVRGMTEIILDQGFVVA